MVRIPYLPNPPYPDGHNPHDAGEAAESRHYFSRNTMRRANSYEDVGWPRLLVQAAIALLLMAAVLVPASGGLGVLALLAGAVFLLITAFVAGAKLLGAASRH
ncbi:hypothetical protein [Hyphobacterium sp.]|uniref:hypothetical protein n=1 Tax=Hyphobacterium sp. TaxID=2004662 RepID=UPI003BA9173E